jgi:hypothetical protein
MRITNTAREFAELKKQEAKISKRIKELQPEVTSWVNELGGKVELEDGSYLTTVVRRDWQYPNYLETKVKTLKQEASKLEKIYQIKNPEKFEPVLGIRFDEVKTTGGDEK